MLSTLLTFLKYEEQLLRELISLSEQQQNALIKFNTPQLEKVTSYQAEIQKNLRNAEDKRIMLLMTSFGITRMEATNLYLSSIIKKFPREEVTELEKIRMSMKDMVNKLHSQNTINRVLANRARKNVREILGFFTNGSNQVCNVTV
ncbi:MAG: flagellar export chaperone FlgN [FCB group bacterium]|jgi:predicted nucleotide-binding protein (sugar kinase/HSP70/actin superfamily)